MDFNKRQILLLSLLSLFLTSIASAVTTTSTWTQADIATNSTSCTAITEIGSSQSKTLGTLSYINSTATTVLCPSLKMLLRYGTTSGVATNSSWMTATTYDASSLTAKYVGVCFNASGVTSTGCDIDSVALTWVPGGTALDSDLLSGLPTIGSDTGGFLKNLAPGVGAFIIILGVFAAIAGIIYAIVGIVKSKVSV